MNNQNLINCFKNVIDIPNCGNENPNAIKINQLPGISIKSLESISKEEQDSYINVVNDIIFRAINRIINDVASYITIELNNYGQSICFGRLELDSDGNFITVAPTVASQLVGGIVSLQQSKFLTVYIDGFRFYSPITQTGTFYLIQAQNNIILDTYTIDLVQGENYVAINRSFYPTNFNRSLVIAYDSSLLSHYKTNSNNCYADCPCSCRFYCSDGVNSTSLSVISNGANLTDNWSRERNTHGVSISYSVNCDFGLFICQNISKFTNLLMYAIQIEYYLELIGSSRLNKFTTTKASDYEKIYEVATKDYVQAYKTLSKSLNFCDDCCFPCKNPDGFIRTQFIRI